jgi:metal-sulfur cluster biosynthetic enzyme
MGDAMSKAKAISKALSEAMNQTTNEATNGASPAVDPELAQRLINEVNRLLRLVDDPELGVNVVDLGLIYDIRILPPGHCSQGVLVEVDMTATTPGCPLADALEAGALEALSALPPEVGAVRVRMVWEPAWTPERMNDSARALLGW